jgi:uncharacterized membrane protein
MRRCGCFMGLRELLGQTVENSRTVCGIGSCSGECARPGKGEAVISLESIMVFLKGIASAISIISVGVVIYGTAIAFFSFLANELRRAKGKYSIHQLRVLRADLGTYLLLGLELLIASDILKTIVEPGLQELLILGGIVALRTVLSFFLDREIRLLELERIEHPGVF